MRMFLAANEMVSVPLPVPLCSLRFEAEAHMSSVLDDDSQYKYEASYL